MDTARGKSLEDVLEAWRGSDRRRGEVAETILAIAGAAAELSGVIGLGPLAGDLAHAEGENADGDVQKTLDLVAHRMFESALAQAPVGVVASEEAREAIVVDRELPIAVALDPIDGSSNIDTDGAIGSIFALYPMPAAGDPERAVLQRGENLLAAGLVVYGAFTALVLSVGEGTAIYALDREQQRFVLVRDRVQIPGNTPEYAANTSNYRHWSPPLRAFVDDCVAGTEGTWAGDFNTRWVGALVGEAYRILVRGGVYLYPGDRRAGYEKGRLRLVYEANPIAFLIEQAGGVATDGVRRILEVEPSALHEHTPLVFGDRVQVGRIRRYLTDAALSKPPPPLFAPPGLFRTGSH